ncbi:MAG: uracil-DNA glycosylase, partial [Gemmatimonadales bacterium]
RCLLCKGRKQAVFGDGDPEARLMFIGEGPGADEDAQGLPFVGRAGQLLDRMIAAMGLSRQQVYIANVVKCRPPGNRAPTPEEATACWPYLAEQIEIVDPEMIVVLGNAATKALLGSPIGITRLRGQWQQFNEIPVMPTFHPSYLLRQYTPDNRRKVWSDLQAVMERLRLQNA